MYTSLDGRLSLPHFISSLSACASSSISVHVYYITYSENYNFGVRTKTTPMRVFK